MSRTVAIARVFNAGCSARLAGLPREACPFGHDHPLRWHWYLGWNDVDKYWGMDATWPVGELPRVKEAMAS